jgi:hypothetical protein
MKTDKEVLLTQEELEKEIRQAFIKRSVKPTDAE